MPAHDTMTLQQLEQADTELFYWINGHHCTAADWVLWTLSQGWAWAVVLVAVFGLSTLRKEPRNWWIVLAGIGFCFLFSDRLSVMCFKDVFCRLRPCHALEGVRMFHTHCGGQYGFVSSHAANAFSVALFLALRWMKQVVPAKSKREAARWRRRLVPAALFLWAAAVCYSRPYLGKHYPGDVICGAALGLAVGTVVFFLVQLVEVRIIAPQRRKEISKK